MNESKLLFLTAGEYPMESGVLVSQVLENAVAARHRGWDAQIVSFVPRVSVYKTLFLGRGNLSKSFERLCREASVPFTAFMTNLKIDEKWSFRYRRMLCEQEAHRLDDWLSRQEGKRWIVHCRSYYAANVGAILKRLRSKRNDVRVVFDSRSLLSCEFPYMFGARGVHWYGDAKAWEFDLVNQTNRTLTTTSRAAQLMELEHGTRDKLLVVPLSGMALAQRRPPDFERRWQQKRFGYFGSINSWNTRPAITFMINSLSQWIPGASFTMATPRSVSLDTSVVVTTLSLPYGGVADELRSCLASVVPGDTRVDLDLFKAMKFSVDFFATKSAEALSLGVPMVVNERAREISEFVLSHECGLVVKLGGGLMSPVNARLEALNDPSLWRRWTDNAYSLGKRFTREAVIDALDNVWTELNESFL